MNSQSTLKHLLIFPSLFVVLSLHNLATIGHITIWKPQYSHANEGINSLPKIIHDNAH